MAAAAVLLAALLLAPVCALRGPLALAQTYPDVASQPAEIQAAIEYVTARGYMNGAADGNFYPGEPVRRLEYACTVVKVFNRASEQPDPAIRFTDLKESDPDFRFANIAVRYGYMGVYPDGSFRGQEAHSTVSCLAGLVKGLGLDEADGPAMSAWGIWPGGPAYSGQSIVSTGLRLKYRSTRAWPTNAYPRGELAFSIRAMEQRESWRVEYVRNTFNRLRCQRPLVGPLREKALDHAFAKVGYPYVWGGESDAEGGYDCSGLTYFVLRSVLGYPMMRTADDQARDARYQTVAREHLLPGDPIFWYQDRSKSSYVGHAGLYIGRGLFIHSSGSNAGVSVDYLSGYWSDNLAWGKRVIPEGEPESFDTYITLCNPGGEEARARLTYMLRDSRQVAEERTLEPFSRKTVKVDDMLVNEEFSTTVEALQGKVVAERAMYFRYAQQTPGGHVSPGSTAPATDWFLAEGCTDYGFDTFVLIQNPSGELAQTTVTFMKEDGSCRELMCTVAPYARYTVTVSGVSGMERCEFSTRVSSSRPVVVERSMYFDYNGIREGHNSQGLTYLSTEWYFAEGYTTGPFDTYILLVNPSEQTANVVMALMGEEGVRSEIPLEVSPRSRRTVAIDRIKGWSQREFSIEIRSDQPVAAERAMYFEYNGITGGHGAVGFVAPATEWYLAEGYTADEFDTYLLVSNPNPEPADLLVRFMMKGGRYRDRMYHLPARSRFTIKVDDEPGLSADEVSMVMASSRPVVAERSMYFRYQGKAGGSCAPAVQGPAAKWYFAEGYTGR